MQSIFRMSTFRLGYSVFLLEKLRAERQNQNIIYMYDIACTLHKYLKVKVVFLYYLVVIH